MQLRTLGVLLLAVGLVVPAAGAATTVEQPSVAGPTAGGAADQGATQAGNETNYTRLYVGDRYQSVRLKPGQTDSVTVTVENGEDHAVELSPHVYVPPRGERPVEKSWVSVESDDTTLDAGETREFEITVSVPEDAELNQYSGSIAFTDETITYPGRPPQPVHAVDLHVEVWEEPTVRILSDTYAYSQVEAGESFTRDIVVENTGDQAVPVNPEMATDQRRYAGPASRETLDRSWVSIDAPSEIGPGETATVSVTVQPPADAQRGDYRAEIDLGIKDPTRSDRNSYWQEISLRFQVWTQPEAPFETTVDVDEDVDNLTVDLTANRYRASARDVEPASFDVTFVAPNGTEVDAERVRTTTRGNVNLGERQRQSTGDGTYETGGERQTFRYRLDDPAAGSWSVKIMPHNAMQFGYEIVRDEGE